MTRTERALLTAALAAAAFAIAGRPGPWGPLGYVAAGLLHLAVAVAPRRAVAALASAVAALGPGSVAVLPLAPLHPLGALLAAVAVASSFALVGAVAFAQGRRPSGVRVTVAWLLLEGAWGAPWLLGRFAFPVIAIGSVLADGPERALAAVLGTGGLSALLMLVGAGLAWLVAAAPPRHGVTAAVRWSSAAAVPILLALPSAAADAAPGETLLAGIVPDGSAIRLRLAQHLPTPATTAAARFSAPERLRVLAPLRTALENHDGRLVIWPETAWPEPIDPRDLEAGPDPRGAALLFGAATVRDGRVFNSVLLASGGQRTIVADKARPVAFTEASLTPGLPGRVESWNGLPLAAAVCWDAVFPHVARAAARAGAAVLVYLADDSYDAGGPVGGLHLRQARLRAVETGLPVVLVQATGPSAAIAPDGRIVARLPADTPGHLDVDLPLTTRPTAARRLGDATVPVSALATVLLFGVRTRWARRKGGEA